MLIEIKNGLADITYKKGRRTINKIVTLNTFKDAFTPDSGIETPLLPFGTRKYIRNNDMHTLYIEFPPMQRLIKYKNRQNKVIFEGLVPMPWGLFKLTFKEANNRFNLMNSSLYATKRPIQSNREDLYFYPLPNIFGDNRLCWGNTFNIAGISNSFDLLSDVGRIIDIFFSSDYNTDLHPKVNKFNRYEDVLREMHNKTEFDSSILYKTCSFNEI